MYNSIHMGIKDIAVMQWPPWMSPALAALVTVYLFLITLRNPMLSDNTVGRTNGYVNDIMGLKYTAITKQTHTSKEKIAWSLGPDMPNKPSQTHVHEYIEHLLKEPHATVASHRVSPLHKIMLLSGCYGDRWGDELQTLLAMPYMQKTPQLNFMLHALDFEAEQRSVGGETWSLKSTTGQHMLHEHDKSMCNCLRDFAAPILMHVDENRKCTDNDKLQYTHDKCSLQTLFDYAVDGSGQVASAGTQVAKLLPTALTRADDLWRNRLDPIVVQVENLAAETVLDAEKNELRAFATKYCSYMHYGTDVRNCPVAWQGNINTLSVAAITEQMKVWAKHMHAYNKLITPTYAESGQSEFENHIPKLNSAAFEAYLAKYKAAYSTCSRVGVPQYKTTVTGHTQAAHWYVTGELF